MSGKVKYGVATLPLFYCGHRGIEFGAGSPPALCLAARIEGAQIAIILGFAVLFGMHSTLIVEPERSPS
jgi:hypothetical protein